MVEDPPSELQKVGTVLLPAHVLERVWFEPQELGGLFGRKQLPGELNV